MYSKDSGAVDDQTPVVPDGCKRHIVRSGGSNGVEIRLYDPSQRWSLGRDSIKRKAASPPEEDISGCAALHHVAELRAKCRDAVHTFEEARKRKRQASEPAVSGPVVEHRYGCDEVMLDAVAQACFNFLSQKASLDAERKAGLPKLGMMGASGSLTSPHLSASSHPSPILGRVIEWASRPSQAPHTPGISMPAGRVVDVSTAYSGHHGAQPQVSHQEQHVQQPPEHPEACSSEWIDDLLRADFLPEVDQLDGFEGLSGLDCPAPFQLQGQLARGEATPRCQTYPQLPDAQSSIPGQAHSQMPERVHGQLHPGFHGQQYHLGPQTPKERFPRWNPADM